MQETWFYKRLFFGMVLVIAEGQNNTVNKTQMKIIIVHMLQKVKIFEKFQLQSCSKTSEKN